MFFRYIYYAFAKHFSTLIKPKCLAVAVTDTATGAMQVFSTAGAQWAAEHKAERQATRFDAEVFLC